VPDKIGSGIFSFDKLRTVVSVGVDFNDYASEALEKIEEFSKDLLELAKQTK